MGYKDKLKQKAYQQKHYQNNKEKYRANRKSHRPSYVARNIKFIEEYKLGKPCLDCGGIFPSCCMEFDHRIPKKDIYHSISALVQKSASIEKIKSEIKKCDLVCSNCHAIRTSNRIYKMGL